MKYNANNEEDTIKAKKRISYLIEKRKKFEIKELTENRTSLQNRALHKFFLMIAFSLDHLNLEFNYTGIKGMGFSTPYTANIVKNFFWRPIQIALFDIKSTKDINTKQINDIVDVIVKFFGEKGVVIEFPNKDLL